MKSYSVVASPEIDASQLDLRLQTKGIMDRREALGILGAGTVGLLSMGLGEAHAADAPKHNEDPHAKCLKACQECATACGEMFHHCVEQLTAGKKEYANALQLMADCEAFCNLSASMIARMSPLMAYSCGACADACRDCAMECEKFSSASMKECAERCRACEKSCREMVKAMG